MTSDDAGGGGADFDSTLYYLKTETYSRAEVDAKLQNFRTVSFKENGAGRAVTMSGPSNGLTPWSAPADTRYGVFVLRMYNGNGTNTTCWVQVGSTGTSSDPGHDYLLFPGSYEDRMVVIPFGSSAPSSVYPWTNSLPGGVTINIHPLFWVAQELYIQ